MSRTRAGRPQPVRAVEREILVQRVVAPAGIPAAATLRRWAEAALGGEPGDLSIRIVDDAESQALNHQYRGKDKPTNVLSFGADDDFSGLLGDLVICASVVAREAVEQGKTTRAHWAHMVVHGCLHLLGYDHESDKDAELMENRERSILAQFGFPDPYEVEHDALP